MDQGIKTKPNPKVDWYFKKAMRWQNEVIELRSVALSCGLDEDLKWGKPCYLSNDSNIVLIHEFKEYCALLFFKGVLLKDSKKLLVQQTANVQAARQIRFTDVSQISKARLTLRSYIREAIDVEKAGLKVDRQKAPPIQIPEELQRELDAMPALKTAFAALTPGRQRGYLLFFTGAKQSTTRSSRIQKCAQDILDGKGLND